MAKTPSDKLFRLVHALSAAEKRYFRLFSKSNANRDLKYLQLFDAVMELDRPDDEALKHRVYGGQPVESKKFSELKAYLYDLILKSLCSYDEERSVDHRIRHYLESSRALYKRGYYDDCKDTVQKAYKLATRFERFSFQLECIQWEKQLAYTRMEVDYLHKFLETIQLQEATVLSQLENEVACRRFFFQVYIIVKRDAQYQNQEGRQRLESLLKEEMLTDPSLTLSHRARVLHYRTLNLGYYAAARYDDFYQTGRKLLDLLESRPHFLQENLSDYIATLSNLIVACGLLNKYAELRIYLLKLRDLKPLTEDDRRKIHRQYFSNIFVLSIFSGNFEEGRSEMIRCREEAEKLDPEEYNTASFYFQYCCIAFGCNDFDEALHYLNAWMNQPRSVEREDLQSLARIILLILHWEMDNLLLIKSLLRSATRFLQQKNRFLELERRFIQFMNELINLPSVKERIRVFENMHADLAAQAESASVRSLLQTFDLAAWLESKVKGQPFAEIVRQKWEAQQTKD